MNPILFFSILVTVNSVIIDDYHASKTLNQNVLDRGTFLSTIGVLKEPAGIYIPYAGSITIPFMYTIPNVQYRYHNDTCQLGATIDTVYRGVVAHIRSIIYPSIARTKRQLLLPAILGGNMLLTAYNSYKNWSLNSKLDQLKENINYIRNKVRSSESSQNVIINKLNTLSLIVGNHAEAIKKLAETLTCATMKNDGNYLLLINLISQISSEFISSYEAALTGRVHVNMFKAIHIQQVITQHPEMKSTLYEYNHELIYELGKVITVSLHSDHRPSIIGYLILPKLLKTDPVPLFNYYTVNYYNGSVNNRILLPDSLACRGEYECWEVPKTHCITSINKVICLQGSKVNYDECLMSIRDGGLQGCNIQITSNLNETLIYQTSSGILVGSTSKGLKLYNSRDNELFSIGSIYTKTPILINGSQAEYISYHDDLYATVMKGFNISITYIAQNVSVPNLVKVEGLPDTWAPLYQYISDERNDITVSSDGIINTLGIITVVSLLLVGILVYKYCHRNIPDSSFGQPMRVPVSFD